MNALGEKRDYVLDEILKYGLDVGERTIYFGEISDNEPETMFCDVSSSSIEFVIRKFNKFIATDPDKPIHFWMSSRGGDDYEMLRLCDRIETCPCPVIFYGGGRIMSAAAWIMCVCDERILFKNATVLLHHGSTGMNGSYDDVNIDNNEAKRLVKLGCEIIAKNTFIGEPKFWYDVMKRDVFLTAEESMTIGLVDKIMEPQDRTDFRKKRLTKKINQKSIEKVIRDMYEHTDRPSDKIVINPVHNVDAEIVEQIIANEKHNKGKSK